MTHSGERKIEALGNEIYEQEGVFCRDVRCSRCQEPMTIRSAMREDLLKGDFLCGNCIMKEKGIMKDKETEAA
jgi:formylmethanofuran dehydrogenase subunit E